MMRSKKKIFILLCVFVLTMLVGCYKPSPLYGTWSDNLGNKIMFASDNTYTATILVNGSKIQYSGNYSVMENVMSFSTEDGTVVTEWDIRGSIMYLQWTAAVDGGDTKIINLALYLVS